MTALFKRIFDAQASARKNLERKLEHKLDLNGITIIKQTCKYSKKTITYIY